MDLHLNRLESALVPLLDRDSLSELTKSLQDLHELRQSVVTFSVEFAVLEEFIHSFLLAFIEHLLKEAEGDLCYEELVMVPIVSLHLGALSRNLRYTVVIGSFQLIKFRV